MFAGFRDVSDIRDIMRIREVKVASGDLQSKISEFWKLKQRTRLRRNNVIRTIYGRKLVLW